MKTCNVCKESKLVSEFYSDKTHSFGVAGTCKDCTKIRVLKYASKNKEKILTKALKWVSENRQRHNKNTYKWAKLNKGKKNAATARRYAAKTRSTPAWLTEDDFWLIKEIYEFAILKSRMLGFLWEVDHIYPLRGKNVCGLHVPTNLQVIPMHENRKKSASWVSE